jgi:hypothetical protein
MDGYALLAKTHALLGYSNIDNDWSHTMTGCHRTVGMVFRYRSRGLLLLLLNSSNNLYHSDTGFREATEVCESFYDTLLSIS